MNKPKEELTEDEIKQIKEYEKKVEAFMVSINNYLYININILIYLRKYFLFS